MCSGGLFERPDLYVINKQISCFVIGIIMGSTRQRNRERCFPSCYERGTRKNSEFP